MSTTKRILGDYTIQSIGSTDKINLNSATVIVNGNLFVTGNSQQVVSTNSAISDNIITLNHGLSLTSPPNPAGAAIEVDRGTGANVQLRWNETVTNWQITADGTTYSNIAISGAGGGTSILANLDMSTYSIYSSTGAYVKFDDNVSIKNTTVAPTAVAGYNVVYAQTPSGGGSGLFITNSTYTAQELVTKSKAVAYSIVFG